MAGGTGGHVFPGLAVADYMKSAGWRVVWLGTEGGMETTLAPRHGYDMETIRFSGLRGKNHPHLAAAAAAPVIGAMAKRQSHTQGASGRSAGYGRISSLSGRNDGVIVGEAVADTRTEFDSGARQQDIGEGRGQSVAGFSRRDQERRKSDVYRQSGPQRDQSIAPAQRTICVHAAAD